MLYSILFNNCQGLKRLKIVIKNPNSSLDAKLLFPGKMEKSGWSEILYILSTPLAPFAEGEKRRYGE